MNDRLKLRKLVGHHSVSDWNFNASNWTLDTTIYTSAPSSLKLLNYPMLALLKHSVSGPVAEGRIVDWLRFYRSRAITDTTAYSFRNQMPDGLWTPVSHYRIRMRGSYGQLDLPINEVALIRMITGNAVVIGTQALNPELEQNTWHKLRLTWWVSAGVLIVRLEKYIDPDWTLLCADFADPANQFAASSINRVGVGEPTMYTGHNVWHDDTEIWIKA